MYYSIWSVGSIDVYALKFRVVRCNWYNVCSLQLCLQEKFTLFVKMRFHSEHCFNLYREPKNELHLIFFR